VVAGGLTAAVAATAVAALVLTSGPGAVPGHDRPAGRTRSVVTAAWTVREYADGTVTISFRQYADMTALQKTLQADGINTVVMRIPSVTQKTRHGGIIYPACGWPAADQEPPAVERAVVTYTRLLDATIHPDKMPHGSAILLAFTFDERQTQENGGKTVQVLDIGPVVLEHDQVPACVPLNPAP
jgi:hypothetical protein